MNKPNKTKAQIMCGVVDLKGTMTNKESCFFLMSFSFLMMVVIYMSFNQINVKTDTGNLFFNLMLVGVLGMAGAMASPFFKKSKLTKIK